jgi:hypothetical protein
MLACSSALTTVAVVVARPPPSITKHAPAWRLDVIGASREGTTMAPTPSLHSFFRALARRSRRYGVPPGRHTGGRAQPVPEDRRPGIGRTGRKGPPPLPREDVTLVLYMDDRHRSVGHAVVAVGWVRAARLSAPPGAPRSAGVPGLRAPSSSATAATGRSAPQKPSRRPSGQSPQHAAVTGSLRWITWW